MSEAPKRRGRPRKNVEETPLVVEESEAQAKHRQHKEDQEAKEKLKYTEEKYYYLAPFMTPKNVPDHKIILVRTKANGSKYRTYVGRASQEKEFIEKIKKEGLLRSHA